MNRINQIFERNRREGRKTLMPFLTAGDPDLDTTARLLVACQQAGAGVCELGFPFSDPIADGPVIQASMTHALAGGIRPDDVFAMVARVRARVELGLVAMVSYSIVRRLGPESLIPKAAHAGFDGLIFPDLPLEECQRSGILDIVADHGLTCSLLISPTTAPDRGLRVAAASSGFVYLLSRSGITGEQPSLPPDLPPRIRQLRHGTSLPIAVGFGISNAAQVRQVVADADAAIVGSAIMRHVDRYRQEGPDAVVEQVQRYVTDLASGLAPLA